MACRSPRPINSNIGDWLGEFPGEYVGEYLISSIPLSIGLSALLGEYGEGFFKKKERIINRFHDSHVLVLNGHMVTAVTM